MQVYVLLLVIYSLSNASWEVHVAAWFISSLFDNTRNIMDSYLVQQYATNKEYHMYMHI